VLAALVVFCGAWSYYRESRLVFSLFAPSRSSYRHRAFLGRGTMYPPSTSSSLDLPFVCGAGHGCGSPMAPGADARRLRRRQHPAGARIVDGSGTFSSSARHSLWCAITSIPSRIMSPQSVCKCGRQPGEPSVTAGANYFPHFRVLRGTLEGVESWEQLQAISPQVGPVWMKPRSQYLESWRPLWLR